jgi:TfoX/Sxy family transcriptional regulator of competence genes
MLDAKELPMQVPRPSDADVAYFRSIVPTDERVEVKPMFGNLGAFVNGNMFMGLYGSDVGLKLSADDAAQLTAIDGAGPFGPAERPMSGWVVLPPAWRGDPLVAPWVGRALAYVGAMPAKATKKR